MAAQMASLLEEDHHVQPTIRPHEKHEYGVHWREKDWVDKSTSYEAWLSKNPSVVFFIHHCFLDQVQENVKKGIKSVYVVMWERFCDYKKSADLVDVLVAPTANCLRFLHRMGYGVKTVYIPWMVDYHKTPPKPSREPLRLFFSQGLPESRRRGDFAYRAVGQLLKEGFSIELLVNHVDHILPRDRTELKKLPTDKVKVYSNTDFTSHIDLMRKSDLFLWPTLREGLGLMGLESLSVGTPVVSFDVPPVNEFLAHGVNSTLAECSTRWFRDGVPEVDADEKSYESYLKALRYAVKNAVYLKEWAQHGLEQRQSRFYRAWNELLDHLGVLHSC